jgi:two-component system heavy metal sensor histidine kinase CusS
VSSNSIALRLSGMFTLVALLVFLLIGGALYQQVDRGLGLLPEAELDARYSVLESALNRYGTPEHWVKINAKLKLLAKKTSASVSGWSAAIRLRVWQPDAQIRAFAPGPTGMHDLLA